MLSTSIELVFPPVTPKSTRIPFFLIALVAAKIGSVEPLTSKIASAPLPPVSFNTSFTQSDLVELITL